MYSRKEVVTVKFSPRMLKFIGTPPYAFAGSTHYLQFINNSIRHITYISLLYKLNF
ncbi:hypothetical protein GCM10011391_13910 [Pullulanibacillus camelliae]|uniref:Uncharacterized protein n=1 Tax=Pullulanibacillus camelliae TaxID=1707096 RepID=A0A8J2VP87_9BACL|nr:hypothetical protein GCM10011391_13910 [Pullulanibacillus camelliae]